ncbi:MAG: penicillin-binding transpeptidase domain-containing protein [Candidatus Eremiobacterota bacterium]
MAGWSGRTRNRLIVLFWLFAFTYLLVAGRLLRVQVLDDGRFAAIARAQQEGELEIPALRGEIRDRNDVVLATSLALYSVALNPREVKDKAGTATALARVLGRKSETIERLVQGPGTFVWADRKVSDKVAEQVRKLNLAGVFLLKEPSGRRFYPKGHLASILLGATGIDDQGLDGLEATFDHYLGGQPGKARAYLDRDGYSMPDQAVLIRPAQEGHHLVLTLDETIQFVAERELNKAVQENNAKGGICLVMDVKTGELLAWAVAPGFPADRFSQVPAALRRNRAITDPYEPGSTFKVFLAASALDSGVRPTDMFVAGDSIVVDGWSIHNANDGLGASGMETLTDIIVYSFNVGTSSVAMRIGKKAYYKHLRAFGFGEPTGVDLVGEAEGIIKPLDDWADIDNCTISFGQCVAATPIQLLSGMQAIANDGVRMRPHLVKAVLDSEGDVVKRFEPTEIGRPIREQSAREMRAILLEVCKRGTGKRANIPGYLVGGKTGTAQVVDNGVYAGGRYIGSFLGIAPIDNPRIAVLVKLEEPTPVYWGGVVAAPVFSKVAREALWKLGVRPNQPIVEESSTTPE